MIADNIVIGFYVTFKVKKDDFMCTGKFYELNCPLKTIQQFIVDFPEGIFLGMLYKEI